MDGIHIQVANFSSKTTWTRNNWHVGAGTSEEKNWPDEISQSPLETLPPHGGLAQAAVSSVHFSFLVKDALWMILGYGCSEGSFAVKGKQLFHLVGIGAQCEWSRWDNGWSDSSTNTQPYIWTFPTCKVIATPSLTNTSAAIDIKISDHR